MFRTSSHLLARRALGGLLLGLTALTVATSACDGGGQAKAANERTPGKDVLTLGAYTTPREAYGDAILPAFRETWKAQSGKEVEIRESFLGSGAQARAIASGFEADVAALSLDPDIETIRKAGLITHDWRKGSHGGIVTRSIVVIGVRPGNPKGIRDWADLAKPGVEVLTPNVRVSGGAMWNVAAIYGAALRSEGGSPEKAEVLLAGILKNVRIMDRSGRDSMLTFERGVGDAIITYENEILVGQKKGQKYEYVVPRSTARIDNPVALVDCYVDKHGSREVAQAFVEFLFSAKAQKSFAEHGLRPVHPEVAREFEAKFPAVSDLFTIADLGGWEKVQKALFEPGSGYDRAFERARKE